MGPGSSVVERFLGKEKVGSSTLLIGSTDIKGGIYAPHLLLSKKPNHGYFKVFIIYCNLKFKK